MSGPKPPRVPVPVLPQHFKEKAPPIQGARSVFEPASLGQKDEPTASQLDPDADTVADDDPTPFAALSAYPLSPLDVSPQRANERRRTRVGPLSTLGVPKSAESIFKDADLDLRGADIVDAVALKRRVSAKPPRTLGADHVEQIDDANSIVIVRNPSAPPAPPRPAPVVTILSMDPASEEEQRWVKGGDTGLAVVSKSADGTRRLVAVYLAVEVVAFDRQGQVFVNLRWHGLAPELEQVWRRKLTVTHRGERLTQLQDALCYLFSYVDPLVGMVVRFLGGPATDPETAARSGYQYWQPGAPSTKVMVDMGNVERAMREVELGYYQLRAAWGISLRRYFWRIFWPELEDIFLLGQKYAEEGVPAPQVEDGLTRNERASMLARVAEMAGLAVASLGKVAWAGDEDVRKAMEGRGLQRVAPTRFTVYHPGDD